MKGSSWRLFELPKVLEAQRKAGTPYHEFLRVPTMSCGVYRLPRGAEDLQGAHDEDEVYYVLEGKARMRVGEELREVGPGSLLYVQATSEHSFVDIEEDITLLVFFPSGGPPED